MMIINDQIINPLKPVTEIAETQKDYKQMPETDFGELLARMRAADADRHATDTKREEERAAQAQDEAKQPKLSTYVNAASLQAAYSQLSRLVDQDNKKETEPERTLN